MDPTTSQTVIDGAEESVPNNQAGDNDDAHQSLQGLNGNSHNFETGNESPRTCGIMQEGQNEAQCSSQPTNAPTSDPHQGIQSNHPPGQQAAALAPNDEIDTGPGKDSALTGTKRPLSLSSQDIADIDDAERQELMMLGLRVKKHRQHQWALRRADEEVKQHASDLQETESRLASVGKLLEYINRQIESLEQTQWEVQQKVQDAHRLAGVKRDKLAGVMRSRDCHREEALGIWQELELNHPLHKHV